ncbi:glycolipid 2-alpha-mannosyltransferase-domain-containing protein, partial [Mycena crocata]
ARNRNLPGVVSSITQLKATFNSKVGYPYVFLNEEPFTEESRREITALIAAPVQFVLIPPEHWHQPSWIDEARASAAKSRMAKSHVISVSYTEVSSFLFPEKYLPRELTILSRQRLVGGWFIHEVVLARYNYP